MFHRAAIQPPTAQVIAQLPRASTRQSAAILSSIDFDRDGAIFATAGVSKRISLFEYAAVLAHPTAEQHCPASELVTRSKLSCLSWNPCAPLDTRKKVLGGRHTERM